MNQVRGRGLAQRAGPLRDGVDGRELDLGQSSSGDPRIATDASEPAVGLEDLVHLLWGAHTQQCGQLVHKYVGAIRRLLEPDLPAREIGHYLTRHSGGYRLAVTIG